MIFHFLFPMCVGVGDSSTTGEEWIKTWNFESVKWINASQTAEEGNWKFCVHFPLIFQTEARICFEIWNMLFVMWCDLMCKKRKCISFLIGNGKRAKYPFAPDIRRPYSSSVLTCLVQLSHAMHFALFDTLDRIEPKISILHELKLHLLLRHWKILHHVE